MNKDKNGKVNLHLALSVFVRGFFEAYAMGVLDDVCGGKPKTEKLAPSNVKRVLVDHYGRIGGCFFNEMFYAVAQLSYADADDAVAEVRRRCGNDATVPNYMRVACREDGVYEAMVTEYKRYFSALLGGGLLSARAHAEGRVRGSALAFVDMPRAIRLLVRLILRTYVDALRVSADGRHALNQVTVVGMLATDLSLLVHDSEPDGDFDSVDALLLHVCGGEANYAAMTDEMNAVMGELVEK